MKFFNKINKAITTTALSAGILTGVLGGSLIHNARDYNVYALPYGSKEISKITDPEFSVYNGVTYGSPSNWSATSDSDTTNSERFVSGIMNLTSDTAWSSNYEDNFHLQDSQNPYDGSASDKNFLYINNFSTSPVKYGYASEQFSLPRNGYYHIEVSLKTLDQAKASLYITGLDETIKMENVDSGGIWKTYTFYIATNSMTDLANIKLEIWLGSKDDGSYGAIFADKVSVFQYDESTFNSTSNKDSDVSVFTDLNTKVSIPFTNNGFETDLSGWTLSNENSIDGDNQLIKSVKIGNGYDSNLKTNWNIENPHSINTFGNERALLIANKTQLVSGVESPKISIKQHGLYRLSIWAYSNSADGTPTILVKEVGTTGSKLAYNTLSVSASKASNEVVSNWTEYSVYIQGNAYKDTEVKLCLYLGTPSIGDTTSSPQKGYVFFDEVRLQELDYSTYSSAISNMGDKGCELNITSTETQYLVPNNSFNKAKNADDAITYPLAPQNFTSKVVDIENNTTTSAVTYSGIVNVNSTHWANRQSAGQYPNDVQNPGTFDGTPVSESTNNVLMIGTHDHTIKQTYTSEAVPMEASAFYKVSFYVQTQVLPQYNTGASVKFLNGTKYIHKIENLNTHGEWQYHEFFIKTGEQALSSTFELGLSYNNGFAFFDELHIESYGDEESFNSILPVGAKVYDLTYENFDIDNTFSGFFDSELITETEKQQLTSGIKQYQGNNVLYISSLADTYYTFTSGRTYSLNAENYYSLSVDVYTDSLSQEEENFVYDEENNVLPYGVTLALKNSSGSFNHRIENVNTSTVNDGNNKFTTYTFYIHTNETVEAYLHLSLGNVGSFVSGTVYFDNIKFASLKEEEFTEFKNDLSIESTSLFVEPVEEEPIEDENADEDTEAETEEKEPFEFPWILVSSIITGLAIVVAIVGYMIRKITIHKVPKIRTSYDRRKTLDVELDRKERIAMRQSMIEELKLQLHTIDDEIEQIKSMFEVREAQILINDRARREQITNDKNAIIARKDEATKEYKSILNSADVSDKDKQAAERQFARYIAKLNKQEESLQKLLEQKETSSALLKIKREQQLQKFIDAQLEIQKEIEKIELEIEQIAKEDEQIWAEYRQAKAEAKEAKTKYIQEKKLEKAKEKATAKKESAKKTATKKESLEKKPVAKKTKKADSDKESK